MSLTLHVTAEPLKYKAKISSYDSANPFTELWECAHEHANYQDAIDCGEAHLRVKLELPA